MWYPMCQQYKQSAKWVLLMCAQQSVKILFYFIGLSWNLILPRDHQNCLVVVVLEKKEGRRHLEHLGSQCLMIMANGLNQTT